MSPEEATRVWVLGEGSEADRHAAAWTANGASVEVHRLPVSVSEAELAEAERPAAASVCLPAEERLAQCRTLLAAGVHVLCAPPVSDTPEDTAALVAAAHESRAAFVPAHPLLYAPGMTRVTAYVFARRLGSVQNVFSYRYGPADVPLLYEAGSVRAGLGAFDAGRSRQDALPDARGAQH